jgi:predicted ATPase
MRAALRWSHDLLSEEEKVLFRRLSAFAGGFTLEAAEAVGAGREEGTEDVLHLLGRLVEQSLVVAADTGGEGNEVRYGMLEPVRQYAQELLEESGEAEETRRRHAEFFLALAEEAEPEIRGPDQVEWLKRLEIENGNLRAAMGWVLSPQGGDAATAAHEGQHLCERFLWCLPLVIVLDRGKGGEDFFVRLRRPVPVQSGPEPVQDARLEIDERTHDVERQRVEIA